MGGRTLLFVLGGFVAGYYICKKRSAKQSATAIENAANSAVDEATGIFDNLLAQAEQRGLSIKDLREHLNQP